MPGLSGAGDVPHAVIESQVTEDSGVGVRRESLFSTNQYGNLTSLVGKNASRSASNLSFQVTLPDNIRVCWETLLVDDKLFVEVPNGILPDGSKQSFVTILEYAEEHLACRHVIVCFKKSRPDRACLVRTFMFLGFCALPPGDELVPLSGDLIFMRCIIDDDCEDDDEEEDEDSGVDGGD